MADEGSSEKRPRVSPRPSTSNDARGRAPQGPGEDEGRLRFLQRATIVAVVGQVPAAWVLYQGLCWLLSARLNLGAWGGPVWLEDTPLDALWPSLPVQVLGLFLLYMNFGLRYYLRRAFPEQKMPALGRSLLALPFFIWFTAAALLLFPGVPLMGFGLAHWISHVEPISSSWLGMACAGLSLAALLGGAYAVVIRRRWVQVRRVPLHFAELPPAFEGYRIVQISDLHIGNFAGATTLQRWVTMANAQKPDLIVVTGDLLSTGSTFVPTLVHGLKGLKAPDGVAMCPGNHDYWVDGDHFFNALNRAGVQVLRNEGRFLARGEELLFLAGVDDTWTRRFDLDAALQLRLPHTMTILLAHDPALFPMAARKGVSLTLSGHTHGGQWAVPFLPKWNLSARVFPFTVGLYERREGSKLARLYVNRGLGTTGPPARIGAAPEITVFTLHSAPKASVVSPRVRHTGPSGKPSGEPTGPSAGSTV